MFSEKPFADKKFINLDGHQMAYIDEGAGQPVVFIHGNPASSYLWRNVMPHLKGLGRLVAPDLMGMGDSAKLPESLGKNRYSLAEQSRYFAGLMDALDLHNVVLVLHDCGSMVGFHWAETHRERVRAIAYMESVIAPLHISDFPDFIQEQGKHMTAEMMELSLQQMPFLVEGFLLTEREYSPAEQAEYRRPFAGGAEDRRPTISFDLPIEGTAMPVAQYAKQWVQDYSDWLKTSDLPKLLIKAEPGYLIRNRLYEIAQSFPNQTETVVQGRHFVQETAPDEVGQAVARFVQNLAE